MIDLHCRGQIVVHTLVAKARYLLLSFVGCASFFREVVCTAAKSRGC